VSIVAADVSPRLTQKNAADLRPQLRFKSPAVEAEGVADDDKVGEPMAAAQRTGFIEPKRGKTGAAMLS